MSTPSISAPTRVPNDLRHAASRAPSRLRRLVRGREADPVWSRAGLWLVALIAGVLTFWGLTRSGYANTYYAEAAQAASHSWKAWFTNALDTSGSDSLDKGPLPNMLMGLSGRVLGFSSFSMLVPEAMCGVGAVLLLHNTVKRTLGHRAALLAALMLALTPIFVAMSRYNNPDALLVLLEVAAAWALVRALQSGRMREVLLCGVLVGLAFNVKMLQAYLIVPALATTLLIAGRGGLGRRFSQLLAGAASMLAVSFAWYGTMMLLPAAGRPWVGDTTDDSWWSLIFGANGLGRVSGEGGAGGAGGGGGLGSALVGGAAPGGLRSGLAGGPAPGGLGPGLAGSSASGGGQGGVVGFGGAAGPLRLFNSIVGGQIAWLLPLALVGLVLGLWARRRSPRTDLVRSGYVLWGLWALVSWAVFSFSKGIFHPYYTTALAPAVAVLAAGGLVTLWDRSRGSAAWVAALIAAVLGTVALGAMLLDRASGFVSFLAPTMVGLAILAATVLVLARAPALGSVTARSRMAAVAAVAGLVALLAGPASYSLATAGKALDGGNPLAGPASAETGVGGFPGGAVPGGARPGAGAPQGLFGNGSNATGGPAGAANGVPPAGVPGVGGEVHAGIGLGAGVGGGEVSKALVSYLKAHQGNATYLVAAVGSSTAGGIALQSGREVIDMGGFMGSDPAPSLAKLKSFISSGQLHYVLLNGSAGSGSRGSFPGDAGGASSAATSARDAWIESHGKVVHASGVSSNGMAMTLYYFG